MRSQPAPFQLHALQARPHIHSHHFHSLEHSQSLPEPSWGTVTHAREDGRTRKLLQEHAYHSSALGFWFFPVTCVQTLLSYLQGGLTGLDHVWQNRTTGKCGRRQVPTPSALSDGPG